MKKDLWLPKGYILPDGFKTRTLLYSGENWQIYSSYGADNILLAMPELSEKWFDNGFLDQSLFGTIKFGSNTFHTLKTNKENALLPVDCGNYSYNKIDAIAFSTALRESRKFSKDASFHDAIYVEKYSRLLPTWTLTPRKNDDIVLGAWLTGGVEISVNSFRRLCNLTGWLSPEALAKIITTAGFKVPENSNILNKTKADSIQRPHEKATSTNESFNTNHIEISVDEYGMRTLSLPGRPQLEDFFNEHVIDIIFNTTKYQHLGIDFPSAIVLYGPPGSGKTFAVEKLIEFIDWPSYSIDSNSIGSPFIHDTSKKISEVFDKALDTAPSVIIIDEMESFLSDRRFGGSSGLHHIEEVAEFLRRIPEAIKNKVLIIAMTNMIDVIDPALLRRGRFDHLIEVGMPSRMEVESLLESLICKIPTSEKLNLKEALDTLTGKALSDSAFVVREAARLAAKSGKTKIDQESLDLALKSLPKNKEKKSGRIGFVKDS